jgi:ABC-type maltose transport system permease subunit
MKKNLLVLLIFFPFFLFSQESVSDNNYENFIKIEPTEVYSSAILIFDFEKAQEITYTLKYNNTIISTAIVAKGEGKVIKKVDFSLLKKGVYLIEYYIDTNKVKQLTFSKL